MRSVLIKVLAARFYTVNTGFFLFFFLLLFGIMNGRDTLRLHYGIMQAINSGPGPWMLAMGVCLAYTIKCLSFYRSQVALPEHAFLAEAQTVTAVRQVRALALVHAAVYAPIMVYMLTAAVVGIAEGKVLIPVLTIIVQAAFWFSATIILYRQINGTYKPPMIRLPSFGKPGRKRYLFYFLHYSLYSRKATFAGVKFFSLLLLQAMIAANSYQLSREAVCVLIMFVIAGHAMLPLYYVRFTGQYLAFTRNLPLSLFKRFMAYVLTYMVIFVPELLFLVCNGHSVLPQGVIAGLYAVAVSQLALYTSLLHINNVSTSRYTMLVFALFFGTLLYVASFDLWPLFVVEAILAALIFAMSYDRYEPAAVATED